MATTYPLNDSTTLKRTRMDDEEEDVSSAPSRRRTSSYEAGGSVPFPVLEHMASEKRKLEQHLLSVELYDKEGNVLWACSDIRDHGYEQRLSIDEDTPSYEEEGSRVWRKHVWTIPIMHGTPGEPLVLRKRDLVRYVRVGFTKWEVKIGPDIGTNFKYNAADRTIEKVALPLVRKNQHDTTQTSDDDDIDALGEDGLYLQGLFSVTCPEMLSRFQDEDDVGTSWDILRETNKSFPGRHDTLRVDHVHLAIAGTVRETLKFFNIVDTDEEELLVDW